MLVIVAILGLTFWLGASSGDGWASSRLQQKLEERDKKIAVYEANAERHAKNEAQLAAENSLLRKANEATAEILKQRDKDAAAREAERFAQLAAERAKKYEQIDVDNDYDSQLCGLCTDAARAGHKLGDSLCGRCKSAAQDNR